jgi:replicative DNA helicase
VKHLEEKILAAALGDAECREDLIAGAKVDWFGDPTNAKIYQVIGEMVGHGRTPDATSVAVYCPLVADKCAELAGMSYGRHAMSEYLDGLRKTYLVRRITQIAGDIPHRTFLTKDADQLISEITDEITALGNDRPGSSLLDSRQAAQLGWVRASQRPDPQSRISTGFAELDKTIGGFQPGRLYLVGARPGQGKSGLLFGWGCDIARSGKTVAGYSLEMPTSEVMLRLACRYSGIGFHKTDGGALNLDEMGRLKQAFDHLGGNPMWLDDMPGAPVHSIISSSRAVFRKSGFPKGAIIVDYLQLMGVSQADTRDQQIGAITRALKGAAKTLGVPVIVASQLNREVERRDDKRPQLSDLRESGSIEQDADCVMFLYRDEYYKPGNNPGVAEIIVAKNRSGPCGTIKVKFDPSTISFRP